MRISLETASVLLKEGKVVAVPTETVYGLAACLSNEDAIRHIYTLKGRPANNPLIIHLPDVEQISAFCTQEIPNFLPLATAFWPGPMTLVIPIDYQSIPSIARAGLSTAAFRIPKHPGVRELIRCTGPLVMPSANLSGRPSSTCAEHIESDFGKNFPVYDGGKCTYGLESTILAYESGQWKIARQGALSQEMFAPALGYFPPIEGQTPSANTSPLCPGQLFRHYSPKAALHLLSHIPSDLKGVLLGFANRQYPATCRLISLGDLEHPYQIAEVLYAALRQLDEEKIEKAYVDMAFPCKGILATITERLSRAASAKSESY